MDPFTDPQFLNDPFPDLQFLSDPFPDPQFLNDPFPCDYHAHPTMQQIMTLILNEFKNFPTPV
jgi:hypothetical protein